MDYDLVTIYRLVKTLQSDSSSLYKKAVLKQYGEPVKYFLATIYDPMKPFHITSKSLKTVTWTQPTTFGLRHLLETLSNANTESMLRRNVCESFLSQNKAKEELIYDIVDKDLKCGISIKTLNAVWPGLVYNFVDNVPLANVYKEGMCDFVKDNWYVSRKLNGIRCLCFIENGGITFYSRKGKEFKTLDRLKEDILEHAPPKISLVLDGELCIVDENGIESFKGILEQFNRKNHTIENIKFFTFNYYAPEEFRNGKSNHEYYELRWIQDCGLIEMLDHHPITQSHPIEQRIREMPKEWEGLMLRKAKILFRRSNSLLKLKPFVEADYRVIGVTKGNKYIQGEETACVASVVIQHKGYRVYVGSGLTDADRMSFYQDEDRIIGKLITVRYLRETEKSLISPTYKGIRDYE